MGEFLPLLAIFGGLAAVLCGFAWLAFHVRRRGTAGTGVTAALAAWEEAYRVTSHESYWEIKAQAERQSPIVSPDGHWRPGVRDATRRMPARNAPAGRVRLRRLGRRWRRR
ncbi:hypothetical protein ABZ769_30370 [Streptomyces olivoreticuli]